MTLTSYWTYPDLQVKLSPTDEDEPLKFAKRLWMVDPEVQVRSDAFAKGSR